MLADPGACRAALFFGEDTGLARESADRLTHAASGGDALRVVEVGREALRDGGLLAAEVGTPALIGGRRVVRVRDAGDALLPSVQAVLAGAGPGIAVLEAGDLPTRSRLRSLLEGSVNGAAVACWRERGTDLADTIRRVLSELGVQVEVEAVAWLAERLGEDRVVLRRELEKLALHAGPGGIVTEADACALVADDCGLEMEDAILAALAGDLRVADRGIAAALAEGASAVQLLRVALRQMQRLQSAALVMSAGASARAAVEGMRPPAPMRHRAMLEQALRRWRPPAIARASQRLLIAERGSKTTGLPDAAMAFDAITALAAPLTP